MSRFTLDHATDLWTPLDNLSVLADSRAGSPMGAIHGSATSLCFYARGNGFIAKFECNLKRCRTYVCYIPFRVLVNLQSFVDLFDYDYDDYGAIIVDVDLFNRQIRVSQESTGVLLENGALAITAVPAWHQQGVVDGVLDVYLSGSYVGVRADRFTQILQLFYESGAAFVRVRAGQNFATFEAVQNGELPATQNGELPATQNGQLAPTQNGQLAPVQNGQLAVADPNVVRAVPLQIGEFVTMGNDMEEISVQWDNRTLHDPLTDAALNCRIVWISRSNLGDGTLEFVMPPYGVITYVLW